MGGALYGIVKMLQTIKKIEMKNILFIVLMLAVMVSIKAQITIQGTVSDASGNPIPGANIIVKGTTIGTVTDIEGKFSINAPDSTSILVFSFIGYISEEIKVGNQQEVNLSMTENIQTLDEIVVVGYGVQKKSELTGAVCSVSLNGRSGKKRIRKSKHSQNNTYQRFSNNNVTSVQTQTSTPYFNPTDNESYTTIEENTFKLVQLDPLSTFSIDVDRAGYANVRRFLNNGQKPPVDAVRIEEMINYFDYGYSEPESEHPLAIHTDVATCPWNEDHLIMQVAMQAKKIKKENLPPSNLVFLIDVSGSMSSANKLPLVKQSLNMLTNQLRNEDKVAIVVYAGAAGQVLSPTRGSNKDKIKEAINNLNSGGSTAGGAGIKLAYELAEKNFIKDGNNRVILATDGDFNVGVSSEKELEKLIESKRKTGIYLTCLGYGMGNYKDSKLETLADKGNGNYSYIDNIQEAQKVLVEEFSGTMFTVAKDVKIQIEFNPQHVGAYRLIGYENRLLNDEDFKDDTKDAGEVGAGHAVTALYEIIPAGTKSKWLKDVDELKYQLTTPANETYQQEIATVKVRYKLPDAEESIPFEQIVYNTQKSIEESSEALRFASSVAMFGMLLRNSEFTEKIVYEDVLNLAKEGRSSDEDGYKAEFIRLVKSASSL